MVATHRYAASGWGHPTKPDIVNCKASDLAQARKLVRDYPNQDIQLMAPISLREVLKNLD